MSLRRNIRQTHNAGAYTYAIVENYDLGYATVRLAENGARLTRLSVTGGELSPGDVCIVDYSSGIPPTVRPVTIIPGDEKIGLELAELVPEKTLQPIEEIVPYEAYWTGGDHGVKAYQWGGTYTSVPNNAWVVVPFTHVDWDTESETDQPFWDPANPEYLTAPAPGYYWVIASVGFSPGGASVIGPPFYYGGGGWQWGWQAHSRNHLDIQVDSSVGGTHVYQRDYIIADNDQIGKCFQAIGIAKLEALERVYLKVHILSAQTLHLEQLYNVYPMLALQWMGNYES